MNSNRFMPLLSLSLFFSALIAFLWALPLRGMETEFDAKHPSVHCPVVPSDKEEVGMGVEGDRSCSAS